MSLPRVIPVISGALFALGLALGGMTDPAKVIGFLDLFGEWDASLLLVMGGAVALNFFTFRVILKLRNPLLQTGFKLPGKQSVDIRLVLGAAIFGVGWGLAGYCPGPALASLFIGGAKMLGFVAALLAGMLLYDRVLAPNR